jgi:hypothetical protein
VRTTEKAVPFSVEDLEIPAGNTPAVVSYDSPESGKCHCIGGIAWSYNAAPTVGHLQVEDDTGIIFFQYITAAGPGFIPFDPPLKAALNGPLVITLAAGGANVMGTIGVLGHWTE